MPPVPHAAPMHESPCSVVDVALAVAVAAPPSGSAMQGPLQESANGIYVAHLNQNGNGLRWSIDVQYALMLDNMVAITVACQSHAGEPVMSPA